MKKKRSLLLMIKAYEISWQIYIKTKKKKITCPYVVARYGTVKGFSTNKLSCACCKVGISPSPSNSESSISLTCNNDFNFNFLCLKGGFKEQHLMRCEQFALTLDLLYSPIHYYI